MDKVPEDDFAWLMAIAVRDLLQQEYLMALRSLVVPPPENAKSYNQLVESYAPTKTTPDLLKEKMAKAMKEFAKPLRITPVGVKPAKKEKKPEKKEPKKPKDIVAF